MRILSLVLIFILSACSQDDNWLTFHGEGLPSSGESYQCLSFESDSVGYLGGSQLIGTQRSRAVLYRTTDQGYNWQAIPINMDREIKQVFSFNDTLIILTHARFNQTDSIHLSSDKGKSWVSILNYPAQYYPNVLSFESARSGYMVLNGSKQLLLRYDSVWDTVAVLPDNYQHFGLHENILYSFIPSDGESPGYKGIQRYSLTEQSQEEILFDKTSHINSFSFDKDQNLYLAVREEKGAIFKVTERNCERISLDKYQDYVPEQVQVFDNLILLIAHREKAFSILGVTHEFLLSRDFGKTWEKEEMPFPLIVKPHVTFRDKFFMTSTGGGDFQKRKL